MRSEVTQFNNWWLHYYRIVQVQPKHVKEAFRLLNKSIIRVETPDIDFEEDQQLLDGERERERERE